MVKCQMCYNYPGGRMFLDIMYMGWLNRCVPWYVS